MARAEMIQALEEHEEVVWLRPATDVVDLEAVPGEEAKWVRYGGWRKASFSGGFDGEISDSYARLILSKPLRVLQADPADPELQLLPEDILDQINRKMSELVMGDTRNDGISRLPTLLAHINERDGDIGLVVCTAGTGPEDYWRDNPAAAGGNERLENTLDYVAQAQVAAIQGLYGVMADASDAILADRIR